MEGCKGEPLAQISELDMILFSAVRGHTKEEQKV